MLVYFVRHGLTDWNATGRFQGQLDIALNAVGLEQAETVARWIAGRGVHFKAIYTSDLQRAAQTAQKIGTYLNLSPIPDTALREIHCGKWQGLTGEEVDARYPGERQQWRAQLAVLPMPGGESLLDVRGRMESFYQRVLVKHKDEAIIVVSHGAALRLLFLAFMGVNFVEVWQDSELGRRYFLGNTSVTIVAHENGRAAVQDYNRMEHLPD